MHYGCLLFAFRWAISRYVGSVKKTDFTVTAGQWSPDSHSHSAEHRNNSLLFIFLFGEETVGVCLELCPDNMIRDSLVWSTHLIPSHGIHHPSDYK
jgi:hypothetical protein